ncbi:hypothetical protein NESM_000387700 [Novymonas esmeraldas]|uniref:HEAT repeat-containing protein 1 n=1 Tax=Novymonas esmeraldas TaxID=1808958 RepID=A0AAW0EM03_9TRYP
MPPKKKGHTLMGRQKVFRHAVEHVRLGLGHTVLGNLSLSLAAGGGGGAEGSSTPGRPAFYVELNEQLLSHTSKDFKRFRWEVLELCETVPLFHLHHRQLAQKLLGLLMDRGAPHRDGEAAETRVPSTSKKDAAAPTGPQRTDGSTTEAYEGFARLTIAFVRDMGSKFLPYFQIFQQAIQAGMYNHAGHLIVDTARLQLVFAVQAAWCRELRDCWADPAHTPLVRLIVRQYVGQLHDTKEYVRRLSAELLAFLCRLSRPLLPLIVEEACGDLLRGYEETAAAAHAATAAAAAALADEDEDADADASSRDSASEVDGEETSDDDGGDGRSSTEASAAFWEDNAQLLDYARRTLPHHPVVDGLTYFAAELYRGVRGSLSSSFETHHVRLLHVFRLLELRDAAGAAVDVVRQLHDLRHPLAPFLDAVGDKESEEDAAARRCAGDLHSTRWSAVFGVPDAAADGDEQEGATLRSSGAVQGAQYLLRSVGSLALGAATATVLRETKKQSGLLRRGSSDEDSAGEEDEEEEDAAPVAAAAGSSTRPSHRILAAAVLCLDSSLPPSSLCWPHYVQLLTAVMGAADFALWTDARESELLRHFAAQLHRALHTRPSSAATDRTGALELAAAVLRLLVPLCLSPLLHAPAAGAPPPPFLLQLQQWFVPVAKAAVQTCVTATATPVPNVAQCCLKKEEARHILFAFAQDVLQKNYALALEQERRMAEELGVCDEDSSSPTRRTPASHGDREDAYVPDEEAEEEEGRGTRATTATPRRRLREQRTRVPSSLTPFALTLLHSIGMALWRDAAADVRHLREGAGRTAPSAAAMATALRQSSARRAVLLARLLQDRTPHMSASPLQQLLRLKAMPTTSGTAAAVASKEASMRDVLEALMLELLQYYAATQHATPCEAMDYVACALPALQLLVSTTTAAVSPVKTALLHLLRDIEGREQEDGPAPPLARATSLAPAVYALYAEVAAMLVQRTVGAATSDSAALGTSTRAPKRGAGKEGVRHASVTDGSAGARWDGERDGLRHLCRTVAVLVHGFRQLRAATTAHLTVDAAETATAISDEVRAQLLHGAEVLLHALLWMLGLDSEGSRSNREDTASASAGAAAATLPAHTRAALRTLRAALPSDLHGAFVRDVLLECLAAPLAGLRLLALRLLRLLCHPELDAAERLADTPAVPLAMTDALLAAAHFNPLSHTGNLDGMRQELSTLLYQVDAGAIAAPFERQLIACTMIGFLYLKFAGAWAVAAKVLCGLVAQEQTSLAATKTFDDTLEVDDAEDEAAAAASEDESVNTPALAAPSQQRRRRRLEPVVWSSVVCVYARTLVMGDVVVVSASSAAAAVVSTGAAREPAADEADDGYESVAACHAELAALPCRYSILLSHQQRHAKGELVSRAFSSAQYSTAAVTLLSSTTADHEVVRWGQHWAVSQGRAGDAGASHTAAAALYTSSTDRSTLAQTFLSILETMVKSSSAVDCKVRLVEDVVAELVAVERHRHPSGIDASQLRKFDQRLEVAMRACAAAPSGVLTAHQRKRVSEAVQGDVDARNAELQSIFLSYLSDANPRLQRVAVDNLKRLRVEPFHTYHAKLIPYCDTMKNLFPFLSTFHVESDVPAHDRVAYVSSAMSLALPKLLTKVAKDKLKDQAVLSRRLMGYLEHLTPTKPARDGIAATDPLAEVFDQLLHRLLSFAMPAAASAADGVADRYDFLTNVWMEVVRGGCSVSAATTLAEPRRRASHHGVRRLERLLKQLGSALRLLEAMLHAVGQRFSVYVPTCLHIALQAYLVACKQVLREPVDALVATLPDGGAAAATPEADRARRWAALLNKSLAGSALSTSLAHVRRAAVTIVALLSEQFPEDVMSVLRGDATAGNEAVAAAHPLFTRYLAVLFENSKGTTLDSSSGILPGGGGAAASAAAAKSSVTPVLRLLAAWVRSPALLPLFPAHAIIAVGTLQEVFAVTHTTTTTTTAAVHRASTQALHEGLRCVSELLSCADEPVDAILDATPVKVGGGRRGDTRRGGRAPAAPTTFRHCFLEKHIAGVFAALYTLLTSGAAREEAAAAAAATATTTTRAAVVGAPAVAKGGLPPRRPVRSSSANKGRHGARDRRRPTSIMSLSVSMWREVMHTIAQLSRFLRADAAVSSAESLENMMSRLLELALKMVAHPVCMADASTAQMVTSISQAMMEQVSEVDYRAHWQPLVRLFNVVVNPHARQTLCAVLTAAVSKLPLSSATGAVQGEWKRRQLEAAARAVVCLNSFESSETLERYDFELRFHTLHSLHDFFTHFGNYGALHRAAGTADSGLAAVRQERAYDGAEDVRLPLDKEHAPVLAAEAVAVLAANVVFFLRDPEQTIRALVLPLLHAMVRYAALGGQRGTGTQALSEQQAAYRALLLETTLRHEVLASLRRGVVAKDVHIRCAHMQAFEGFARYFSTAFPSFALLYSPNTEQNFYANVGHVQHRCRLHALSLLRQHAAAMNVRDVLRVFVPFMMSAVKDFAEGKRNQANLTEGRARGYCDAVLLTVSTIAARLPWTAYYRVLSLFLSNASANVNLRATMLRGVVQVLHTFRFLDDHDGAATAADEAEVAEEEDKKNGDDDEDDINDADDDVRAELSAKQREYRHAKVMRVLEADVLPQLYSYIGDKEATKAIAGRGIMNQHSITAVRREQEREDAASKQTKNALLQLPVAMAITKIVKHFTEDRFNVHINHLLDELIKKLRTKNDKHRESARRILGAMLQETGPSKLKFVVTKLKDNLVHGYQLHVLGYTVVTLLYQLYEPNSKLLHPSKTTAAPGAASAADARAHDPVQEALDEGARKKRRREGTSASAALPGAEDAEPEKAAEVDEDTAVERAEEALLRELGTTSHAGFDHQHGIDCLTAVLEELLLIFLDDYLGEVGVQKEQVEVMSTMVEVKRNRALQGFAFLGKHCDAATVMEAFLHRITWVLTPPSDSVASVGELHGSARARAMLVQEMKGKYLTIGKGGSVDLAFVNKVRLLAVRVARSLMTNATMSVEKSFEQVRRLLDQHNHTREEKIAAFEAKDGTRRIRGNAHLILHQADRQSRKEQLDQTYLVAAVPERVDVDFSAHTVLATQQKQKLRVYRGRYGKEVMEAARNFYREDPVTAVVLDTLDEFLLKFLLSVLKQVLGIGKEKRYSKAAMKLDMLRHHRAKKLREDGAGEEEEEEEEEVHGDDGDQSEPGVSGGAEEGGEEMMEEEEERNRDDDDDDDNVAVVENDEDVDGLGAFAEAQAVAEGGTKKAGRGARGEAQLATALLLPGSDLTVTFTREHRALLESLVPAVLTCLQGEGSDAVVANALDCLLALVSLRPPLDAVNGLQKELFETVTSFIERGSVIKQRAIRLTAAMVAHQKYVVSEANAVQLVKLVRAEVMERNEYMSVSLSLLYAILGKHTHVAEVYDLMDVITELLLHWSAQRVIRRRCILILVRFLLEYRLTPEKFKSHIDLFCRNLDYPELTGRTALLELLDALVVRLPAVILREEAPVLLVPLAATVSGSEWVECRRQGSTVLQHLARYAGVDVLVPVLSTWMAAGQPRATRTMGVQTWATIVPALAEFYGLGATADSEDGDDEAAAPNRAAFQACCAWSVQAVLDGCLLDQSAAARRNKQVGEMSAKSREKVEKDGWAYIFYSLRAAESMLAAVPHELYPLLAPRLLPHITEVLLLHTHPWVRAVAMRVLRHYLYTYVERRCRYLQEDVWQALACQHAGPDATDDGASAGQGGDAGDALPFTSAVATASDTAASMTAAVAGAMQTLHAFAALLKRLLGLVSTSDVAMETYNAHRAIADPARGELLKVAVYVLRAQNHLAVFALTRAAAAAARPRYHRDIQQRVGAVFTAVQHQLHSLSAPVVQQGSLVNYMVRSTTLLQLLGGWVSVLPHETTRDEDEEPHPEDDSYNAQVRWLTQTQLCPAALLRGCVLPLLGLGLRAKPISEKISLIALQVSGVVEQQLEGRRRELTAPMPERDGALSNGAGGATRRGQKRQRSAAQDGSEEASAAADCVPLDEVLLALKTQLASIHDARRDMQVVQSTKKVLKRSRRQMELEERKHAQQSRHRSGASAGARKAKSARAATHRRTA